MMAIFIELNILTCIFLSMLINGNCNLQLNSKIKEFPYIYWKPHSYKTPRMLIQKDITQHYKPINKTRNATYDYYYGKPITPKENPNTWKALPINIPNKLISPENFSKQPKGKISKNNTKTNQYRPVPFSTYYDNRYQWSPPRRRIPSRADILMRPIRNLVRKSWPTRWLNRWKRRNAIKRYYDAYYYDNPERYADIGVQQQSSPIDEHYFKVNVVDRTNQVDTQTTTKRYDILDYDRYHYNFNHQNQPNVVRQKYNENLIELMRKKIIANTNKKNYFNRNFNSTDYKPMTNSLAKNKHKKKDPTTKNEGYYTNQYKPLEPEDIYYKPMLYNEEVRKPQPKPPIRIPSKYKPSIQYKQWLKAQRKKKNSFSNLYYTKREEMADQSHKYYYEESEPYDYEAPNSEHHFNSDEWYKNYGLPDKGTSIMDRIASIQNSPAVLVPGGLAALGLGLAYYYFNYVWYPTPVVTARLSNMLLDFLDKNNILASDDNKISEVTHVLSSFEAIFSDKNSTDSCKQRLVCQLHQEVPGLWQVTQTIFPLLRTHINKVAGRKNHFEGYLNTAKEGSRNRKNCKDLHKLCLKPYSPLKDVLNNITSKTKITNKHGQSRIL